MRYIINGKDLIQYTNETIENCAKIAERFETNEKNKSIEYPSTAIRKLKLPIDKKWFKLF